MRHPEVPESLESWWILHRMFEFDRISWDNHPEAERSKIARSATEALKALKKTGESDVSLAQMLGHKGNLMLTHYSKNYDGLAHAQTVFDKLEIAEFVEPTNSYVSILELGLYDATGKIHATLKEKNLKPSTPEWISAFDELLKEQEKILATPAGSGLLSPSEDTSVSTQWIKNAAKMSTGIRFLLKNART